MRQYGVIAVLDGTHYRLVQSIWDEIERACGPRSPVPHPYPHFTFQTAERYDLPRLDETLRRLAAQSTPFRVATTGLAIFNHGTGVYIGVGRSPRLDRFHNVIWPEVTRAALATPHEERAIDHWVPHITLALGPRIRPQIPRIVEMLYQRNLRWDIEINNLTVVYEDETHKELIFRHDFPHATDRPPALA